MTKKPGFLDKREFFKQAFISDNEFYIMNGFSLKVFQLDLNDL